MNLIGMNDSKDLSSSKALANDPTLYNRYVGPVWTRPEYQGQGIASALLDEVIQIADATTPPTPMYLEASPKGQPVYAKLDWVRIDGTETAMLRRGPAERT